MKKYGACALVALCLPFAPVAEADSCPAGQQAYTSRAVTLNRTLFVPGNASGMFSGVVMRKGLEYQISAEGSIRVGVFGETGTPPEGWEPQGAAGPGFPSPSAFTFSLIYRMGRMGSWNFAGPGPMPARLGATDPDRAELYLAINDTKTSDNSGGFNVTVKEIVISTHCRVAPPPATTTAWTGGVFISKAASGKTSQPTMAKLPCAGITPDGRKQGLIFGEYCPGVSTTRPIPVEACTYAEGRQEALGLVNYGCHLAEAN